MEAIEISEINSGVAFAGDAELLGVSSIGAAVLIDSTVFARRSELFPAPRSESVSFDLLASDAGRVITVSPSSAMQVTVPPGLTWPANAEIVIVRLTASEVTVVAGSGVTIRSSSSQMRINALYSAVTLRRIGSEIWVLHGDKKV